VNGEGSGSPLCLLEDVIIFENAAPGVSRPELIRFARRAQNLAGVRGDVSILVAGNRRIQALNRRFRKKNKPTDVLSFPAANREPKRGGKAQGFLGDIAIAPETARRYAHQNGRTLGDELRVLILHGVLHLIGYDHETDHGQMDRLERRLRRRLGIV